ncbi:MAG TPA: DJ-1/PfpI family protein [Polyangia bacterium]|nr:DJ-1/PfpI family protein [Polyangia bacterium]
MSLDVALLLFPGVTQLDLTGPFEVFRRIPDARVHVVWKDLAPVRSDSGLSIVPTATLADVRAADVLCVPGGAGQIPLMEDEEVLDWIAGVGAGARFVTSVCVGSLLLGAAGLLRGYRATSHWASLPLLAAYGASPVEARVVVDRNRVTGGGVTAGIDFALTLAELVGSRELGEAIQLALEYDPSPPFTSGHPRGAPASIVERVRAQFADRVAQRTEQARRYAAREITVRS